MPGTDDVRRRSPGRVWTGSSAVETPDVRVSAAMGDFTGRAALVTGATRGIGFGIAQEIVARGGNVCITARKPDELDEAVAALDPGGTGVAVSARGSADDAEHQEAAVKLTVERFGRLDYVVNN